ncbi:MAG: histidine kinase [Ferruginibacter sp.]
MFKKSFRYWACQLGGWGGWALLNLFIAYQFASDYYLTPEAKRNLFFTGLVIDFAWCVFATHLLRSILKKGNWMRFTLDKVLVLFIVAVVCSSLVAYYGSKYTAQVSHLSFDEYVRQERKEKAIKMEAELGIVNANYFQGSRDSSVQKGIDKIKTSYGWFRDEKGDWTYVEMRKGREFSNIVLNVILFALWLLIYFVWHYINKNRKDQLDKLLLESTVKDLELKTIKSHINPHFIFNSLNSIRALVDENPQRARKAITELSNILRSSMQAEKMETVTLERELDIVNDYLALEQMRFEERLKIELDIDEDTLGQPIPPMMLQTLVENAIKHGISKQMSGGVVRIISDFTDAHHELIVQNTGQLSGELNNDGFGIKSTVDRLNLLYQGKASFEIHNMNSEMVESKIIMPLANNLQLSNMNDRKKTVRI